MRISDTITMGDARITAPKWNLVQVGRVVLFNNGLFEGRLATIVEIIDHKRVRLNFGSATVKAGRKRAC